MTSSQRLVEYIENSRFLCAAVLEDSGSRVRALNQNGREVSLPYGRIVHASVLPAAASSGREDLLKALRQVADQRRQLAEAVDLAGLWEVAAADGEAAFPPEFLASLCFGGDASADQVAACLRAVLADRLYFKFREGKIVAQSMAAVAQRQEALERERQREALLGEGARNLARLKAGEPVADWPTREACLNLLASFYLHGSDAPEAALARDLLKRAGCTRPHDPYLILVQAGFWAADENFLLGRYGVPVIFAEEVLAEAAALASAPPAVGPGRRDLTSLPVLTIDGEATADFDDALHLEERPDGLALGIHISDVAALVRPDSGLFEEAARRATSLYFPEGSIPMLPAALSEDAASLRQGQVRPAMSFLVQLTAAGEVVDFTIQPSLVRVARQLTYQEADRRLTEDRELRLLAELAVRLRQRRLDQGALVLPIPDVNIVLDPQAGVRVELAEVDTPARLLVAELMVLANSLAAQYLADRQVPALFRCQGEPKKRLFTGLERDLFLNFRQRRFLSPMELTVRPRPHSGVGVMQYTTVTSPIRRFLDLVVQHQLHSVLAGRGAAFSESALRGLANRLQEGLTRASTVRSLRHRYWLLRHLEGRVGQRLPALFLERQGNRVLVLLTELLFTAEVPATGPLSRLVPGDALSVRLERADALDNDLRLTY
ncbi:MAG: ribonuclease catalytic domain-containing protein [Thermodesulfobacteriota bacterium]